MSNTAIWDRLGRTDPEHTKGFTRSGGFKGTAIKPTYTELKMTEEFGPCGTGWGFTEPSYQVITVGEEIVVYCWLSLWYVRDGERSDLVPGVGGDYVAKKNKYGLAADDEAFKKAFTDALGNAMKHLGMSADVHMGLFDDSKYVADLRREQSAAPQQQAQAKPAAQQKPEIPVTVPAAPGMIPVPSSDNMRDAWRAWAKALTEAMKKTGTVEGVNAWMQANEAPLTNLKINMGDEAHSYVTNTAANLRGQFAQAPSQAAE